MTIIYIPVEIIDKKQSRFRSENDLPSLALGQWDYEYKVVRKLCVCSCVVLARL